MTIDAQRIRERLKVGSAYISALDRVVATDEEKWLTDLDTHLKAERIYEVLSQIMLDICTHIVANSEITPPMSYAECILKLATLGVFPIDQARLYSGFIKMRNLVVHQYSEIDYSTLLESLKGLKVAFLTFRTHLIRFLAGK